MEQREVTARIPLTDKKGRVTARGYARHFNFDYDNRKLSSSPFSLKEWDFYQISNERYVLQLTIGHVSYASSVNVACFDTETGERHSAGRMEPLVFKRLGMEQNPELPHKLCYEHKGLRACFEVLEDRRILTVTADEPSGKADVRIELTNCSPQKDKMVIATPFFKPKQFYLNYKESGYIARGSARFGDKCFEFGEGSYGLLDCGRGVWPFRHKWDWGSGATCVNGKVFSFNIGWGFGDTSAATENIFFYDNKGYKLGKVTKEAEGDGWMAKARYCDEDGRFDLTAVPVYDNYTETKILFANNFCHQVWSRMSGTVKLDDGTRLELPEFLAFVEHAENQW